LKRVTNDATVLDSEPLQTMIYVAYARLKPILLHYGVAGSPGMFWAIPP